MASTTKEKKYARKYYRDNDAYRRKKINDRKSYSKSHRKEEAQYAREYYASNPEYRSYKIKYAKAYKKAHKNSTKK